MSDILVFTKYMMDCDAAVAARHMLAAVEKLLSLYPGKRVLQLDALTLTVETDSLYSDTGVDVYELGLVDKEIPAIRCVRDGRVITFRG